MLFKCVLSIHGSANNRYGIRDTDRFRAGLIETVHFPGLFSADTVKRGTHGGELDFVIVPGE